MLPTSRAALTAARPQGSEARQDSGAAQARGSRAWVWQPPGDIGITSAQPGGVGERPDFTLNFMWMKARPALLDREQGQREGTVVAAGAGPEAKGWS